MKKNIKVMLVEDHPEYRDMLKFMLDKEEGMEMLSKFGNAELALRSLQPLNHNSEPDVILLDLNLPGMSGLEAMPWFEKYTPDTKIIILSQSDREADVLLAVQQGAAGYLLKSATMQELTRGIRTVISGGATLEPGLARFIMKTLQPRLKKTTSDPRISKRELEVLALIGDGLSQKEIADRLNINIFTVGDHLKHIYAKLNVANAPAAVNKAHRLGIFSPEE
ncbi:response regulator transcription factor [Pontiellaceae bacterium B12219]|nr:response regulator transcription factor [Pontiellaceae bacterium B12219]